MALLQYEPWNMMARLHRQIDQLLADGFNAPASAGTAGASWTPAVDIHEEADKFVVRADLPGVESKDISVTAEKGVLTVSGQRQSEQQREREQHRGYARIERADGSFVRRFTLPESVKTDEISARHHNGVLELTIPKARAPEPRRVSVETH